MNRGPAPLVSVVVPCHGRPEWLGEALDSVARQSHEPIEIIVVDDASPSSLRDVVERIDWGKGHTTTFVRLERNVGPGAARERGRHTATGEFIAYLDSDDIWHPANLERQLDALRQSPGAGMSYTRAAEFSELPLRGDEPLRPRCLTVVKRFLPHVLDGRPWDTSACLWTRAATDRIGPWFPGWIWEDYEYDCRAGCLEIGIAHVPVVLTFFRKTDAPEHASSAEPATKLARRSESLDEIVRQLRSHGKLLEPGTRMRVLSHVLGVAAAFLDHNGHAAAVRFLRHATSIEPFAASSICWRLLAGSGRVLPGRLAARVVRRTRRMSVRVEGPRPSPGAGRG